MLKVGITGGIGSGKSTVAKVFSTLGVSIYDADNAAKILMATHEEIKQKLIAHFGEDSFLGGTLNREYLSSLVFSDDQKLQELNAIVHPVTIKDAELWFSLQDAPYAIKEAALIFESQSEKHLDYVIGVWAPADLRIKRTLLRGGITEGQIKSRMAKQMDEDQKMKLCDFVIDNSGERSVIEQIFELHQRFQTLSGK